MEDEQIFAIDTETKRAYFRALNTVGRVTLPLGKDDGNIQTHQTVGYTSPKVSETYNDMQRYGEFGLTSMPLPGAKGIVNYQGGHRGFQTITGVEDPRYRPKGLKPGESGLYAVDGAKADGTGGTMWHAFTARLKKVASMLGVTIIVGNKDTVTITETGETITITGSKNVTIIGASGDVRVDGVSLVNHTHGGITRGSAHTDKPDRS
jgi:phage baseplate assembly protein V